MGEIDLNEAIEAGYNIGVQSACVALGADTESFSKMAAAIDVLRTEADAQMFLCKTAKLILGDPAGYEWNIYDTIEKSGSVSEFVFDTYIEPVVQTLVAARLEKVAMTKEALGKGLGAVTGLAGMGSALASGAKGVVTDAATLLGLLAIGGGALGGGALWSINRDPAEEDVEIRAKEDQAAYYKELARDLKKRIKLNENKDSRLASARDAAKQLAPNSFVI